MESDQALLLLFTRLNDHWEMREVKGLESTVHLSSVDADLKLSDIYALIEFGAE